MNDFIIVFKLNYYIFHGGKRVAKLFLYRVAKYLLISLRAQVTSSEIIITF